jgi:hypothetical protein
MGVCVKITIYEAINDIDVELFKIELVASNKSGLLLKNILQKTQTLQLFTKIIKTVIIYKSNKNDKPEGQLMRPCGLIQRGEA